MVLKIALKDHPTEAYWGHTENHFWLLYKGLKGSSLKRPLRLFNFGDFFFSVSYPCMVSYKLQGDPYL